MLKALEIAAVTGAVAASAWLAWRALSELYQGACEAAHGAANTRRRLQAQRMRIFALAGLSAVVVGAVAMFQRGFAGGGVLKLSGGMLVFGLFAWASARTSRRVSRQRGSKREHVRERMRAHRRRRQQQQQQRRRRRSKKGRQARRQRQQREVRRALRTLELREGATLEEVKHAWRRQALRHHPDRHVSDGEALREQHAEAFRRAQRAYDTLSRQANTNYES